MYVCARILRAMCLRASAMRTSSAQSIMCVYNICLDNGLFVFVVERWMAFWGPRERIYIISRGRERVVLRVRV